MTKLIFAFRNFVNEPKKGGEANYEKGERKKRQNIKITLLTRRKRKEVKLKKKGEKKTQTRFAVN